MLNFRLTLLKIFHLFDKSDRKKIYLITLIQVLSNFLDLIGVALLGVLGSLAISGSSTKQPGSKVESVLNFLNIDLWPAENAFTTSQSTRTLAMIASLLLN